ncbi:hypothetical protein [Rhizobium sp. G21]|uniref:hypothetical protein n=1 Tax=Rhizobium sp. G21 TaxID=2758439 RepID=UPI001FEDF6B0|nr:hypothetical protein [Rhizobium sp. G21]
MTSDTMRAERKTRWLWLAAFATVLIGLALRLPEIGSRSLWIDELYSHWFASRSYAELWRDVPQYETHPPSITLCSRPGPACSATAKPGFDRCPWRRAWRRSRRSRSRDA